MINTTTLSTRKQKFISVYDELQKTNDIMIDQTGYNLTSAEIKDIDMYIHLWQNIMICLLFLGSKRKGSLQFLGVLFILSLRLYIA